MLFPLLGNRIPRRDCQQASVELSTHRNRKEAVCPERRVRVAERVESCTRPEIGMKKMTAVQHETGQISSR